MTNRTTLEYRIRESIAKVIAPVIANCVPEAFLVIHNSSTRYGRMSGDCSDVDLTVVLKESQYYVDRREIERRITPSLKRMGCKVGRDKLKIHITPVQRWEWETNETEKPGFVEEVKKRGVVLFRR